MTDINGISRIAYEHAVDPIDWAVQLLTFDLEARDLIASGQIATSPNASLTLLDQSDEAYARRMVAKLIDAGWSPPDVDAIRRAHSEAAS